MSGNCTEKSSDPLDNSQGAGERVGGGDMKYTVHIGADGGEFVAECPELGLTSRGFSPANALDQLRENIRFNLEMCPCTTIDESWIDLDVS